MKNVVRPLLCVIACLLDGSVPAAQNRVVAQIPITVARNKIVVPVTAGGTSLRLILDTGMHYDGILIFDKNKVDVGAFSHLRRAQVAGAGAGDASGALTDDLANFQVGRVAFENQRVTILTGESFKGFPTDGVIGYSLLGHYGVEIDYDRNVMRLYESETFAAPAGWESLDIYFKSNRIPWIDILIATEDEPLARLSTYIDLASSEALELLSRPTNRFRIPTATRERYLGRGLSGDIHGHEGTIARMRIGSQQLVDVVVAIAPAEVRSKQDAADGVLGNNALRRFNVIFDYAHDKMYVRRNSHFSEPFQ